MTLWHIGADGQPHPCSAHKGQCPFGGFHSENKDAVRAWHEEQVAKEAKGGRGGMSKKNRPSPSAWSEPDSNGLLVYGTPNRTYDSEQSFYAKMQSYDEDMRALGATPVEHLEGKWKTDYERSIVYRVPKPKTEEEYDAFKQRLQKVVDRFNQDAIMVVRKPFPGEKTNATNYWFDGISPEQAHDASTQMAAYMEAVKGRMPLPVALAKADANDEKILKNIDCFGSSYSNGRFSTFDIDEFHQDDNRDDTGTRRNVQEISALEHYFSRGVSHSRVVIDSIEASGSDRDTIDSEGRSEGESLGYIRQDLTDDYKPDTDEKKYSNSEEKLDEWRNDYRFR